MKSGAPVTGITLSTRVGRLSETHSDTGFQLTQFSPEKEWLNGKVKSPCKLKVFSTKCLRASADSRQQRTSGGRQLKAVVGNLFRGRKT